MTARIAVTADLHYHPRHPQLTPPFMVEAEIERIRAEKPDAVVVAGDLAHGLDKFEACLSLFSGFDVPVGVLLGNHDLWRDRKGGYSTEALWERVLPEAIARAGAVNLEREILRIGDVAVAGSIAWYDYSAIDPGYAMPRAAIVAIKKLVSADAMYIDWKLDDAGFAAEVGLGLRERVAEAAADEAMRAICVVTHVPLLEAQMLRKPHDRFWAIGNAFFGNLTLGEKVLAEPKVRAVVSGHTHVGREAVVERAEMPPVYAAVVPADYGRPAHLVVEV